MRASPPRPSRSTVKLAPGADQDVTLSFAGREFQNMPALCTLVVKTDGREQRIPWTSTPAWPTAASNSTSRATGQSRTRRQRLLHFHFPQLFTVFTRHRNHMPSMIRCVNRIACYIGHQLGKTLLLT